MSLFDHYKADARAKWKLIFGSARRKGEIDNSRYYLSTETYEIAIMLTPSEGAEKIWYISGFWTQWWEFGGAKYGAVLPGIWNVYAERSDTYPSLGLKVPGRMVSSQ